MAHDGFSTSIPIQGKNFYACLAGSHEISPQIVQALMTLGMRGSIYVRDAEPADWGIAPVDGISILRSAPNLEQIARQSAIISHHGGLGTIHAALATGRPQVLIPQVLDQMLSADALQEFPIVANIADDIFVHSISIEVCHGAASWLRTGSPDRAELLARMSDHSGCFSGHLINRYRSGSVEGWARRSGEAVGVGGTAMRELLAQRALVTGAASGIGRAISLELARHGVDLFLWDIDAGRLTATQQDCQQLGVECTLHICDLSSSIVFTTPETVARRAVVGIRRNPGKVVITPLAHSTWLIHHYLPSLLELISLVGRRKGPLPEPQPPDSLLAMPDPSGCAA